MPSPHYNEIILANGKRLVIPNPPPDLTVPPAIINCPFLDGSGTTATDIHGNANFTAVGCSWVSGGGLQVNQPTGSTITAALPTTTAGLLFSGDYTICGWITINSAGYGDILSVGTGASNAVANTAVSIIANSANTQAVVSNGTTAYTNQASTALLATNRWFFCFRYKVNLTPPADTSAGGFVNTYNDTYLEFTQDGNTWYVSQNQAMGPVQQNGAFVITGQRASGNGANLKYDQISAWNILLNDSGRNNVFQLGAHALTY